MASSTRSSVPRPLFAARSLSFFSVSAVKCTSIGSSIAMNDANPQTPFQEAVCGGQWKFLSPFVGGNEEQTDAVLHVLKSRDLVTSIRGPAGSGKTTMCRKRYELLRLLLGKMSLWWLPLPRGLKF